MHRRVIKEGLRPYLGDNCQAWELDAENRYKRKSPRLTRRAAQEILLQDLTGQLVGPQPLHPETPA